MSTKVTIKARIHDQNGFHLYEDAMYGLCCENEHDRGPVFLTLHNCGFESNVEPNGKHTVTVEINRSIAMELGLVKD